MSLGGGTRPQRPLPFRTRRKTTQKLTLKDSTRDQSGRSRSVQPMRRDRELRPVPVLRWRSRSGLSAPRERQSCRRCPGIGPARLLVEGARVSRYSRVAGTVSRHRLRPLRPIARPGAPHGLAVRAARGPPGRRSGRGPRRVLVCAGSSVSRSARRTARRQPVPGRRVLGKLLNRLDAGAAGARLHRLAVEDKVRDLRRAAVPLAVAFDVSLTDLHGWIIFQGTSSSQPPSLGGGGAILWRRVA